MSHHWVISDFNRRRRRHPQRDARRCCGTSSGGFRVGLQMDEAQFEAKISRLLSMQQRGLLSAEDVALSKAKLLAAFATPPGETTTGLPAGATVAMGAGATVVIGGRAVAPMQLQSPAPQLQLAPAPSPTGPTAAQLAAQQLDALQQTQAAQLEQMQQQMQQQMAAAQAAVSAAAPAPVAAPQVQFQEQAKQATRSTSSGEKAAAPAAAPAVAAPGRPPRSIARTWTPKRRCRPGTRRSAPSW